MKVRVTLFNSGGELASKVLTIAKSDDEDEAINLAAGEVIEEWILSVGDTITITEVV